LRPEPEPADNMIIAAVKVGLGPAGRRRTIAHSLC
jgi:hypothetical protein